MRIAHNMSMDHFRRIKRMPTITTNYGEDIFDVMNFQSPAVDNEIMSNQTAHSVKQMVDNLPDDLREVVILRHYADLSFKEIAQLTNCSINTALGRMRYALQNLKKQAELKHVTF
jgi:RNA polymerase sigma-70 factor (ECF subfamily)